MVKIIARSIEEMPLKKLGIGETFVYTNEFKKRFLGMVCYDDSRDSTMYFNLATGRLIRTKDGYYLEEQKVFPVDIVITY